MPYPSLKKHTLLVSCLLILATAAAYSPLFLNGFTGYDDWEFVTANPYVKAGLTWQGIGWAFQTFETSNWHPVTWLSHMLDCRLFGLNAGGHHFTSLVLHIASALLLFFLLSGMTRALWRSALVAALFSLHPLHVESVAWAAERKDTLSTLFWMLTALAYHRYTQSKSPLGYISAWLFFLLGLMSKPMLVTLPFTLLLLDYWPLGRFQREEWKTLWREKIPFFALSFVFSLITIIAQMAAHAVSSLGRMTLDVRLKNALAAYGGYIKKMFWPEGLAVFYPHPGITLPLGEVIAAAVFLLLITVFVLRRTAKHPYLGMGWFWYLGTLVPVIGLIQVGAQAMADRYTYVPLIGVFIMISWGLGDLQFKFSWGQKIVGMSAAVVLTILGFLTWNQVRYWKNDVTLFEHALRVTKRNYVAHNGLGLIDVQQGRMREAIEHFSKALEFYPNFPEGQNNLGLALKQAGDRAGARLHLFRAVGLKPDFHQAYNNLGNVFLDEGNYREAIRYYSKAVEIKPDYVRGYYNRGVAMAAVGNYEGAMAQFTAALRIDPAYADARNNLELARQRLAAISKPS